MAYATQDQVLNYLQGGQQDQTAGIDPTSSKQMGSMGGGSGIVNTGSSAQAPQQGTGGQSKWTNIQNYIGANQSSNAQRANTVKQQVEGTFGQEKKSFQDQSQQAKTSAEKAAEPLTSVNQDKASQLITQATSAQKGSDQYKQSLDPLKQAYNYNYQAPKQFSYGLGSQAQEIGGSVGDQQKFHNFLGMFDKKLQGGRDLSVGQKSLQNQLDVQNTGLEEARQGLANQYQGLTGEVEKGVGDINSYLGSLAQTATSNQSNLKKYLEGEGSSTQSKLDAAVAAHNKQVEDAAAKNQGYLNELDSTRAASQQALQDWNVSSGPSGQWFNNLSNEQIKSLNPYDAQGNLIAEQRNLQSGPLSLNQSYANMLHWNNKDLSNNASFAGQKNAYNKFNDLVSKVQKSPEYVAGQRANTSTVGGAAAERAKYNALMDIFGRGGIEEGPAAQQAKFNDNIKWGV